MDPITISLVALFLAGCGGATYSTKKVFPDQDDVSQKQEAPEALKTGSSEFVVTDQYLQDAGGAQQLILSRIVNDCRFHIYTTNLKGCGPCEIQKEAAHRLMETQGNIDHFILPSAAEFELNAGHPAFPTIFVQWSDCKKIQAQQGADPVVENQEINLQRLMNKTKLKCEPGI